jgi:hypothetical protein
MPLIVTPDQLLHQGLRLIGITNNRIENILRERNLERFRAHYGSNPIVYAQMWEDLQTNALIDSADTDLALFLMTIYFLKCYPTEAQLAATFHICKQTVRKWCWFYAIKIQALKELKVSAAPPSSLLDDVPLAIFNEESAKYQGDDASQLLFTNSLPLSCCLDADCLADTLDSGTH